MQRFKRLNLKSFDRLALKLSIKSKLMVMLLGVSLGSILVVGYISLIRGRATIKSAIFNQLTSIRASKAHQFELFFENLRHQVQVMCADHMAIAAMVEFNKAYKKLNQEYISPEWDIALEAHYSKEFFPKLYNNIPGEPVFSAYRPESQAARYLQYRYIVQNSNPVGEKDKLVDAEDGSDYSRFHRRYHEVFREIVDKFGYYDLFLINHKTGEIVYSVYKETDFATSLSTGPYNRSNLAKVVRAVQDNPDRGAIQIADFEGYRPSYAAPAAFIAGPIYNGPHIVGILAIQLPVDKINQVMTGGGGWHNTGLGRTGETYLVGADLNMRSVSRFLIETPQKYESQLRDRGTSNEIIQLIKNFNTTIMFQEVNTDAARAALEGQEGTQIVKDYRGVTVLSAYAPLNIEGLKWGILAEMDLDEAYAPMINLQTSIFVLTVILILAVTWIANFVANQFVKPIDALSSGARKVGEGQLDTEVNLDADDELGQLAQTFNTMVQNLRQQRDAIAAKSRENDALLLNILPSAVAERRKKGETQIADNIQQATVLFARVRGFSGLSQDKQVSEAADLLDELINAFDEAAEKYDVEKHKTIGERYIAACGLTKQRLDHTKRVVDFALEMSSSLQRFNNKHQTGLTLSIGIQAGAVMAAIVGGEKFRYDLWGSTVDIANHLNDRAHPNTILVAQDVYERLQELYVFEPGQDLPFEDKGSLKTWILKQAV